MPNYNKITLIGHLGRDPETRSFQNGGEVVNFSLATSEKWKDKSGQPQSKTQWHNISITNTGAANIAKNYLKRGDNVMVIGQLEYREWENKDGQKVVSAEICVKPYSGEIVLLGGKKDSKQDNQQASYTGGVADLDDDIPF